jgi:hypothetical protein
MNLTFLIPIKLETSDRVKNVTTVLSYLISNYDAKILVREFDTRTRFEDLVLQNLHEKFDKELLKKINFSYDIQDKKYFHKTKILNDLIELSDTEIVCNYDADVILPVSSVNRAYNMILSGESDAVYPYGVGVYQKAVTYTKDVYAKFLKSEMGEEDIKKLDAYSKTTTSTIGWCQFIRKENYINSFMMNENFAAWGPEDCELYYRLNILGNKVDRVNDFVYHLEHQRSNDSWFSNPSWQENMQLWGWIRGQDKDSLIQYYKNQDYVKRRNINASI